MGKKFMPKLFSKKSVGGDGSTGPRPAATADGHAPSSETPASSSAPMKSSMKSSARTASAHSEDGGEPEQAAAGAALAHGSGGNASNGDRPHPALDGPANTSKTDSNGNNGSSSSNNGGETAAPILVPTMKPKVLRQSSSVNMGLESAAADKSYEAVPLLEIIELPRGGVSIETSAVGPVQFGIPPETIKDSMNLGLDPPSVYIVPVDRFCRDMGPALGVNLAEFEFPAYFNFFIRKRRCTLIVDSVDAERNIRKVFNETLLGPAQFRQEEEPLTHAEEDFAPEFPREAIPDFYRELKHFRIMPNGEELVLETLLKFCHFETAPDMNFRDNLGAPPKWGRDDAASSGEKDEDENGEGEGDGDDEGGENEEQNDGGKDVDYNDNGDERASKKSQKSLTYSQIRWIGKLY